MLWTAPSKQLGEGAPLHGCRRTTICGVRGEEFALSGMFATRFIPLCRLLQVEADKPATERGHYIHRELFGAPEEKSIEWARHPQMMRRLKETRERQLAPVQQVRRRAASRKIQPRTPALSNPAHLPPPARRN